MDFWLSKFVHKKLKYSKNCKMNLWNYKKIICYLKSSGVCLCIVSGGWILYEIKNTQSILNSIMTTKVLDLEQSQAQYIYIDDPRFKDIFMFNNANDLQASFKEKQKNLSQIIIQCWKSLNRNLAFRLLEICRTGNITERRKAVNNLSSLKHLKDSHYCHIAQMLNAQTAVALARFKADLRFFLKPPYFYVEYKLHDVIEALHGLLRQLNSMCGGCHICLSQFLTKKFKSSYRDHSMFEHDLTSVGVSVPPPLSWNQNFLLNCVHAMHHHSSLEEHTKDIVNAGGLPILMSVYKVVGDNVDICTLIAKILSNLSLHPEYLEDIFISGWIGVLAKWSRHSDIRLSAPASRALANLDQDETEKYPQRIYPLYPLHKVHFPKKLDVIFIHGLLGGVFVTWRQRDINISLPVPDPCNNTKYLKLSDMIDEYPSEFFKDLAQDFEKLEWQRLGHDYEVVLHDCPENVDSNASGPFFCDGSAKCMQQSEKDCKSPTQCWPKDWLPEDVPNLRILGINYTSNLSMWTPLCPIEGVRSTIKERSSEFTGKLIAAGVGNRPIIWACHSMGGLLVKKMLVEEWKNGDKSGLVKNTKGIVFFSTPHRGSHVAALSPATQILVWPSIEVQELCEKSPNLLELHSDFLEMMKEKDIEIISFGETKPTRVTALNVPFIFVNKNSADPGVGEFFEIPQDHLSICKPASRQSFLYQKFLAMVRRHIPVTAKEKMWKRWTYYLENVL